MYQKNRRSSSTTNTGKSQNADYNKLVENRKSGISEGTGMEMDRVLGSPAGSTLPNPVRGTWSGTRQRVRTPALTRQS